MIHDLLFEIFIEQAFILKILVSTLYMHTIEEYYTAKIKTCSRTK